jgi:hypothetical protein
MQFRLSIRQIDKVPSPLSVWRFVPEPASTLVNSFLGEGWEARRWAADPTCADRGQPFSK